MLPHPGHHIPSATSGKEVFIILITNENVGCYSSLNCRYQLIKDVLRNGTWGEAYVIPRQVIGSLPRLPFDFLSVTYLGSNTFDMNSSDTGKRNIHKLTSEIRRSHDHFTLLEVQTVRKAMLSFTYCSFSCKTLGKSKWKSFKYIFLNFFNTYSIICLIANTLDIQAYLKMPKNILGKRT